MPIEPFAELPLVWHITLAVRVFHPEEGRPRLQMEWRSDRHTAQWRDVPHVWETDDSKPFGYERHVTASEK